VWFWTHIIQTPGSSTLFALSLLYPDAIKDYQLWRLVTYMFLHGDFWHLLFNMWGLYIFGQSVAEELGRKKFLMLYFISGIFGGLLWTAANWNGMVPVVGASGAVFGVMLAMAMLNPEREYILLFFPFPVKCRTLIVVYAAIEFISQMSNSRTNIAHLAHLGGFFAAYFYIRYACSKLVQWDPLGFLDPGAAARRNSRPRAPKGWTIHKTENKNFDARRGDEIPKNSYDSKAYKEGFVPPKEIDRLLDKISASGINSLSPDELQMLRLARKQMKRDY
jgi:membrane associated rhomboid family serine protease